MNHCVRHYEEAMTATCRSCNAPFCSRCLVFAFGPKKPPFCIGCALNAGGVRNGYKVAPVVAAEPSIDRRAAKAAAKASAKAAKAAAKAEKAAAKGRGRGRGSDGDGGGGDPIPVPMPPAAVGAPVSFDGVWSDHEEHDARVPATAQLASLMRTRHGETAGQPI